MKTDKKIGVGRSRKILGYKNLMKIYFSDFELNFKIN